MAGHSQFKNIMHRKGSQDKRRAKKFTKLIRELQVAARSGQPDPDMNAALKNAVSAAKAANMPKDNIERAIKRALGDDNNQLLEEIRYEGYGPGGVAIVVEALTDNRNRTASEIRTVFTKHGGSLGETNSVVFQFQRIGSIIYLANQTGFEDIFEAALEAGATDVNFGEINHEVICVPSELHIIQSRLETVFGPPAQSELQWKPLTTIKLEIGIWERLYKLLELLEDNDDVRSVSANYEMDDCLLKEIEN